MKCDNEKCWLNKEGLCTSKILRELGIREKERCGTYIMRNADDIEFEF